MYINGIRRMLLDLKQSIQNTVLNFTQMKMRLLERNRTLLVSIRNARCEDHVIFKTHNF